jgi:hypothetical protein
MLGFQIIEILKINTQGDFSRKYVPRHRPITKDTFEPMFKNFRNAVNFASQ